MIKKNKNFREPIKVIEFRTIQKDFYEVKALSQYKTILDGRCCSGILLEILERAKQDKAIIYRIRGKSSIINRELQDDLKYYKAENKSLRERHEQLKKTLNG